MSKEVRVRELRSVLADMRRKYLEALDHEAKARKTDGHFWLASTFLNAWIRRLESVVAMEEMS